MKKLLLGLFLLCAAVMPARAQIGMRTYTTTAIAHDVGIGNIGSGIADHQITWNVVGGTLSACTVALDSSVNNSTWSAGGVITGQTCTSTGQSAIVGSVVNYIRINVTAFTVASGTPSLVVHWNGFNGASGGSVTTCTATGGVAYESSSNVVTCGARLIFTPGTVSTLDINNSSTGAVTAPLTVRGAGSGSFTPAGGTALLNLQQESSGLSYYGLAITNAQAVGSSGVLSAILMNVSNAGLATIAAGNAVGDANGNYTGFYWDASEGITVRTDSGVSSQNIVPFTVQGMSAIQAVDIFRVKNSAGTVVAAFNNVGALQPTMGVGSCTPPAVNGQYTYGYTVTASAAVAATCPLVGLVPDAAAGATILYSDNNGVIYNPAAALALPTPSTLGNANFYTTFINNVATTSTVTPATWTIALNGGTAGASAVIPGYSKCSLTISQTVATQWNIDCVPMLKGADGLSVATLLATGIVDGTAPITVTTGTTATLGAATYKSGYTFNQEGTPGTAVTYTLPATAVGLQYCVANSIVSGTGAADTGVLTVYPPSGSYVILNGVRNTIGGGGTHGVASGGAAADAACFVAVDATDWVVYVQKGTWTEN